MNAGEQPVEPPGPDDDEGGETVVVDRTPVPAQNADEGTVVIDRSPVAPATADDGTVVIDRGPASDEGTVVIDRSLPAEEGTVVIDRSAPDEGTVVIEGRRARGRRAAPRSGSVLGAIPRRGQRRALTPAPGGPDAQRTAVLASGAGAVTAYAPRSIPAPPPATVAPDSGQVPTRAEAPSMPSVVRASTRRSRVALAAFAAACVVSVIGLVVLVVFLTAG